MKKNEIQVGNHYAAKVNNRIVSVKVLVIRKVNLGRGKQRTVYDVVSDLTGRQTIFSSAGKFRRKVS